MTFLHHFIEKDDLISPVFVKIDVQGYEIKKGILKRLATRAEFDESNFVFHIRDF